EAIIEYYSLRWTIESFFKFAKQNLSLAKCHSRDESAQSHFLILIAIAYLIFNDLLKMLQTSEENLTHCRLFYFIRKAVSIFAVTYFSRPSVRTTESFFSECRYSKASQRLLGLLLHTRTG
ncbi:MAG: transposase, partial [Thermotogae bacterium]|nr:transposase [Thermotogota bacterium]